MSATAQPIKIRVQAPQPIEAEIPVTLFGVPEPVPLNFKFRYKTAAELEALQSLAKNNVIDAEFLFALLVDWDPRLADDADQAVPFDKEALAVFIGNHQAAAHDIYVGYLRKLRESRIKN
jgi:hypothetical protein